VTPRTSAANSPTREKLLETARQLFHSQGFHATGLAQILKEAEANSGSLYHFFGGKEDLLIAVLRRYVDMLQPVLIDPIFERVDDPIERIFALLDGYRQMLLRSDFAYGCPIGKLALELDEFRPEATALIAANFKGWRDIVQGCLDGACLGDEVDTAAFATFILTTMEGAVMQSRSFKAIEPFDESVAMLRDYVDRLLPEGSAPQPAAAGGGQP